MPGFIDQLRAYFTPGGDGTSNAPFAPWQRTTQKIVEGGTQGILGTMGLGDDSSQANRGGQLISAALPLAAPHPAITALLKSLGSTPEVVEPLRLLANDKVGGWVPRRAIINPPEGFSFTSAEGEAMPHWQQFMDRDPALSERFLQEQSRFNNPTNIKGGTKNANRPNYKSFEPQFDSKFSLTGAGVDDAMLAALRKRSY